MVKAKRRALGDTNLQRHEIQSGNFFGHGMLNLQPGIHFEEVKRTGGIQQEFNRTGSSILDALGRINRRLPHLCPQRLAHHGTGRFLNHFLMSPLHRTIAFTQMDTGSMGIRKDLHLDMAWLNDRFFKNKLARSKGILRFRTRGRNCCIEIAHLRHQAHAATTAASGCFNHERKTDPRTFCA